MEDTLTFYDNQASWAKNKDTALNGQLNSHNI